jgi:predicted phage baseplate assembly protein
VVEVEEDGAVWLRFGDGVEGRAPQPGQTFRVDCRLGNGTAGNIGAEALTTLLVAGSDPDWVLSVRNPLPGANGVDPEPLDYVRTFAPTAFQSELRRAVCGEDYATLAKTDDRVRDAGARLRWLGTHYEVLVVVDLFAEAISPALDAGVQQQIVYGQIEAMLNRYRRIGHEVYVVGPVYVPLLLRLSICVSPNVERGRVKAAVEAVLGANLLPGGKSGFFYADNLTFDQTIETSALIALVQAVPGVTSVVVLEFRRLADAPGGAPPELPFGPLEIPQLEADSQHPELGQLLLQLEGGR